MEPAAEPGAEGTEDPARPVEPVPWGRLVRLSGGSAISLMPRPEQPQGRALNEVTLGRGKVRDRSVRSGAKKGNHLVKVLFCITLLIMPYCRRVFGASRLEEKRKTIVGTLNVESYDFYCVLRAVCVWALVLIH